MHQNNLPWADSKTWKPGYWYPSPTSYLARDQIEWILNGYGIYMLDPSIPEGDPMFGDIVPAPVDRDFTFDQALEICEARNGERLIPISEDE